MPIDARLMMADYSGIERAGESIGKGIQAMRMNEISGLAGKALMGDPSAMAALKMRDPMAASKVNEQLAAQAAAEDQQNMMLRVESAKEMKPFFEKYGMANSFDEFRNAFDGTIKSGMMPYTEEVMKKRGHQLDESDYIAARLLASGNYDKDTFDNASKIRSELKGSVDSFNEQKAAFESLIAMTSTNSTPFDQLGAVFNFMKSLDPGSVVKEGEQVMVKRADGVFGILGNYINALTSGKPLNEDQLQEIQETALKGFTPRANIISKMARDKAEIARKFRIDDPLLIASDDILNADKGIESYASVISENRAKRESTKTEKPKPKSNKQIVIDRGMQLEAQGMSDAEIEAQLRKEGLI